MEYAKAKQIKTDGGTTVEAELATKASTAALTGKQDILPADSLGLINKTAGSSKFLREDGTWQTVSSGGSGSGDVEEAPTDGKIYGRKDAGWEEVAAGGGGDVEEAPVDGKLYARKDSGWTEVVVESGMLSLDFDQDALLLAGRHWPLFDDFPDTTKNYKGYVYNDAERVAYPYTATYVPSYLGWTPAVQVEIFPDINVPIHFSYLTLVLEESFGPDPIIYPVAATPFFSASTSTGLPSGVSYLQIFYQLENTREVSIAEITVSISAGYKDVPILIDLYSLTTEDSQVYGMPVDFYPAPFEPAFAGATVHGQEGFGLAGVSESGVGFKAYMSRYGDLVITSDRDTSHSLRFRIPVTKRAF